MAAKKTIGVIVAGAYGRMGRKVVKAVSADSALRLAGAFDAFGAGQDAGEAAGIGKTGIVITDGLKALLKTAQADVVVDFTTAEGFEARALSIIGAGLRLVVGTTGVPEAAIKKAAAAAAKKKTGVLIAPNFAIGAVLMMKFAALAAPYMPAVEIIELHHDRKLDAPSGTAIYTAQLIADAKKELPPHADPTKTFKLPGARGGKLEDIAVHSVRLPGYIASQEVIFGGMGQTLSIRHDTISRESFMPGVVLAVKRVMKLDKLVVGLENIL